ncbi:replicative DNA helicase [Neofamilia massiliensis]|uniref:replicative DNA helicase n=1 Tax=Neofamilia massiliensis TaxID=1673724 RepID=UPI0006BB747A|nr:replicative DNA helicase [Neofamilia massiliensis]
MAEKTTLGRIPPYSNEAEQNVLGILLRAGDQIDTALELIRAEDFYNPIHGEIFRAMVSLSTKSAPIDLLTTMEELRKMGKLEEIGGVAYLGDLSNQVVTTLNIEYYLQIIKDKSILRQLIEASARTLDYAYEDSEEVGTVLEFAEKGIFDISQDLHSKGLNPLKEVLIDTFDILEKRMDSDDSLTGVTSGFIDLDNKLSGFQKSDLVLLAARPSMGKTALMVNFALNAAAAGKKVAVFSLEMSQNQLAQRMMSAMSHVDLQKIISGKLESEEMPRLLEGISALRQFNISIDDTAGITPLELKAKARKLKAKEGLDLIVIDYLQLMEMGGRNENRTQEISAISRNLKAIAKELDIPVIALSQLSRATEVRQDKRPILSDLRESGAIEQDADVVLFLYRDEYYNPETEKRNIGEVIIAKHRNGPTGVVELTFLGQYTKFVNMARGTDQ